MIVMLNKLLKFNLLSKEDAYENMRALVNFINHPNTWIREEANKYIDFISEPKNAIMSAAEVYCLVRPEVKQAKKLGYQPIQGGLNLYKRDKTATMEDALVREAFKVYRVIQSTAAA